ncbi:hypothetical protein EMCG_02626 [[Emmonsia] crescens]|uniref:Uncharacterized protein n=1 Tax=[Emmonsia] crescens TaxID=73230 RepID=A0A0G2HYW9_9EURO|nr:hypothetical protein EMCG_02626 [Emmonsia crescens UAMH 3008]
MNQALGLTHLPGSQQQQDHPVCSETTSTPQADNQLTASPSSSSNTQLRQQSPDSLFGEEGTSFELSWENQLMDTLYPEELPTSDTSEQNTSDAANSIPETGSIRGAERLGIQTVSGLGRDINSPLISPVGDQHESDCRKRPFDDDNVRSTHFALQNDARPSKRQLVEQTFPVGGLPHCSTITSDYHECEDGQSANVADFPPDFQLPDLPEIPDFLSSFQLPDDFDFDALNTTGSTDNRGTHSGGFSSSGMPYTPLPPDHQKPGFDDNPSACASVCGSEKTQIVGHALQTTVNAFRSSLCSSLTSLSADSHAHDSDKICSSLNRLNRSHAERELSPHSLFGGSSPIATPPIENVSQTNTAQHREEACPSQYEPATIQFVENDITKNFRLGKEDILATQYREIFCHVPKPGGYISPYPKHHGPLGYFPSAPATHARCIEVAPDDAAERLEEYRQKLQKVSSERNRYKSVWMEWKATDPKSGKSKEQMLKEEPFRLKRALFAQEKKTEEFRKQAEDWRGQFNDLALAYNGLVQHLHMLQAAQVPQHPPLVTQPPPGHPTPVPSPQPELVTADSSINLPPNPSRAPRTISQPPPITIDLTEDEPTNDNTNNTTSGSSNAEEHARNHFAEELRKAMRRKEYHWLGKKSRPRRHLLPAIPFLGRDLGQESTNALNRDPSVSTPGDSALAAAPAGSTNLETMMERLPHESNYDNDDNDELARTLEAELERGTSMEG